MIKKDGGGGGCFLLLSDLDLTDRRSTDYKKHSSDPLVSFLTPRSIRSSGYGSYETLPESEDAKHR